MSLFSRIFGEAKKPEELASLAEAGRALEAARRERSDAQKVLDGIGDRRRAALLADEADKVLVALDAEHDKALLTQERLDALEPRILTRISELQTAEKRQLFEGLIEAFRAKEAALDAALDVAVEACEDYREASRQIDASGFGMQGAAMIARAPLHGDGVLASRQALEFWRRGREALADRRASFAARPMNPLPKPAKVVPIKKAPPAAHDPGWKKIEPRRLSGPVGPGRVRVECILDNVSFADRMCVCGDQFDIEHEIWRDHLSRGVAFKLIALGENLSDAAQ